MTDPLVSILTPSFNQGRWLGDNLRSVDSQTYSNLEHIVMDGGSTDDSVTLLGRESGPRVIWISEPDRGQSHAINKAFARSAGQIIGWINSDDAYADTRAVERAVELFDRFPSVDVVYGDVLEVTSSNVVIGVAEALPPWTLIRLLGVNPVRQPGAFIRRRAIEERFLDPTLHYVMDHELFLRLLTAGHAFVHLHEIVAVNRRTPGRKTMSSDLAAEAERTAFHGERHGVCGLVIAGLRYALSVVNRMVALPSFLRLDRRLSPALPLSIPSRQQRVRLQLATRFDSYANRHSDR
jgi:glycosyltransferase involved in cell wall biosynthesis